MNWAQTYDKTEVTITEIQQTPNSFRFWMFGISARWHRGEVECLRTMVWYFLEIESDDSMMWLAGWKPDVKMIVPTQNLLFVAFYPGNSVKNLWNLIERSIWFWEKWHGYRTGWCRLKCRKLPQWAQRWKLARDSLGLDFCHPNIFCSN